MKTVDRIIFKLGSKEEYLPGYSEKFPYIASRVELHKYPEGTTPWHWHNTLELFYVEKGAIEYYTPQGRRMIRGGSGGLVNSNVLHMTKFSPEEGKDVSLIHLFDPVLISGERGNLIDQKYVIPFITDPQIEILTFSPDNKKQEEVLRLLKASFLLEEEKQGYEIRLREALSEIWLKMLEIAGEKKSERNIGSKSNHQIKQMMIYIQEHYSEKISVSELADAAYLSERGCYRVFQECLHMTPADYIKSYRLQMACRMLIKEDMTLAEIGQMCGFGSSSYFGKTFKESIGCTPAEYKRKWQNSDI